MTPNDIPETLDAIEECHRRGWTDGLPVMPPTADRVEAMLAASGLPPQHVLGEVPVRRRVLTAERAAANAVMAGCLPEHFPVLLAALEAFFESSMSPSTRPRCRRAPRCSRRFTATPTS